MHFLLNTLPNSNKILCWICNAFLKTYTCVFQTVEKFFSKEIKYLVSDKREAMYARCLRQNSPVPGPDSGQSSPHPRSNRHQVSSHGDDVKSRCQDQTDTVSSLSSSLRLQWRNIITCACGSSFLNKIMFRSCSPIKVSFLCFAVGYKSGEVFAGESGERTGLSWWQ